MIKTIEGSNPYLGRAVNWAQTHKNDIIANGAMTAATALLVLGIRVEDVINGPSRREAARVAENARAAAAVGAADALRLDYVQTAGVNLESYGQPPTYVIYLRESAKLAISKGELLGNAVSRIRQESGCELVFPPVFVPADRSLSFSQRNKDAYLATTANC